MRERKGVREEWARGESEKPKNTCMKNVWFPPFIAQWRAYIFIVFVYFFLHPHFRNFSFVFFSFYFCVFHERVRERAKNIITSINISWRINLEKKIGLRVWIEKMNDSKRFLLKSQDRNEIKRRKNERDRNWKSHTRNTTNNEVKSKKRFNMFERSIYRSTIINDLKRKNNNKSNENQCVCLCLFLLILFFFSFLFLEMGGRAKEEYLEHLLDAWWSMQWNFKLFSLLGRSAADQIGRNVCMLVRPD